MGTVRIEGRDYWLVVGKLSAAVAEQEADARSFTPRTPGRLEHPLHEDVLINMGDVLPRPPRGGLRETRITGRFK